MIMLSKKRLDIPFTIKSISDSGVFSGYGSVFGVRDSYSDIVVKGAFTKSLNKWKEKGRLPALLWQHKMDEPIGYYTKMIEDDNGLYVEGQLLIDDDPLAKRAYAHMKVKSLSGLSIGYFLNEYEYDKEKSAFLLTELDLLEVSVVTFPANDEARIDNVKSIFKSGDIPSPKEIERVLRDVGLSRNQAKAFMSGGYSLLKQRDVSDSEENALNILKSINF